MNIDLIRALAVAAAAHADAGKALSEALFLALDAAEPPICKHEEKTRTGSFGDPGAWTCNGCGAEGNDANNSLSR